MRTTEELLAIAAGKLAPVLERVPNVAPENDRPHPFVIATEAAHARHLLRFESAVFAVHAEARRGFPSGTIDARGRLERALALLDQIDESAAALRALAETT